MHPGTLTIQRRSMWQSCSAHIRDKTGISVALGLKYPPVLPSGNSTLKVWRAGHRLASFKIGGGRRVRFYSSHAFAGPRDPHPGIRPARDFALSDAQRRTIYALSTPPGKAGVAVVRISGPDVLEVWQKMIKPYSSPKNKKNHPEPWKLERCRITDPWTNESLDDGLVVFFKCQSHYLYTNTLLNLQYY